MGFYGGQREDSVAAGVLGEAIVGWRRCAQVVLAFEMGQRSHTGLDCQFSNQVARQRKSWNSG